MSKRRGDRRRRIKAAIKRFQYARLLPLLVVVGFVFLAVAAFLVSTPLGWAVSGLLFLALEWRLSGGGDDR